MRNITMGGIAAIGLLMATGANAQSFTYDIAWGDVEMVGGVGPDGTWGRGGTVSGTYETTFEDDSTSSGTVTCAGMDQPPSSGVFALHMACTASDGGTSPTTIFYGCNYLGEQGPETPLSCVGGIRTVDGVGVVRRGTVTMHWHGQNEAHGTGQWYE